MAVASIWMGTTADNGGGIYAMGKGVLRDTVIRDNIAKINGGGLVWASGELEWHGGVLSSNIGASDVAHVTRGGACYCNAQAVMKLCLTRAPWADLL